MARTLAKDMTGDDVRMLQAVLNYHRQLPADEILALDGIFGDKTDRRVRAFQTRNQLISDGLVGSKTREMLMTICQFSAEYVVTADPLPIAGPVGNGPVPPVTTEYELSDGLKLTLNPWEAPPAKLRYVLEFEAAWVFKNPGLPAPFSLTVGAELGRTLGVPSPEGTHIITGGGQVMGKFSREFEKGPIKLDTSLQAGFEAEHALGSHDVELASKASLASCISFTVLQNRFYLFTQGELGAAVKWFPGTVQASAQWEGTAGFKLTF